MQAHSAQQALAKSFDECEENCVSFLLFSLGNELYGTPLLSTREVIRRGEIKPAPYMVSHFKGVINLRGQIVSVIDLRTKFSIEPAANALNLILIIETPNGILGTIVDDLVSVESVHRDAVDQDVKIESKVPLEFFLGVAKVKDRLVNMVDIAACLSAEELRAIDAQTMNQENDKGKAS